MSATDGMLLTEAGATQAGGRIALIDTIRALALLGVILMNYFAMHIVVSGMAIAPDAANYGLAASLVILVMGKARSCFAFLFGLGFGILLSRAQARGGGFDGFYVRRMLALMAFGVFNAVFLFWGDILIIYAVLGMALMLFRGWSQRALLIGGMMLILVPPLLHGAAELAAGQALANLAGLTPEETAARFAAIESVWGVGTYAEAVRANVAHYLFSFQGDLIYRGVYLLGVLGLFLMGLWTARSGLLADMRAWRPRLRRIAWICLPLGLVLSGVYLPKMAGMDVPHAVRALGTAAYAGLPVMAFGYLAAWTLILTRGWGWVQTILAPVGRMALTNYLASCGLGTWMAYAYGLGLTERLTAIGVEALALGVFAGLTLFSHLWLGLFRLGPAEWLWRCLSHGRIQPLLKARPV